MPQQKEMRNLDHLNDCWDALAKEEWAYFFMRGCEGYKDGRSRPPVYKNNASAQHWWFVGYTYLAKQNIMWEENAYNSVFCRAFLKGVRPVNARNTYTEMTGYNARLYYETEWGELKKQKGNAAMAEKTSLYKVKGKDVYGKIVGTDSLRRTILEIAGQSGQYLPFNADEIEEVMPYTITLASIDRGNKSVVVTEGQFNVGDVLLLCDNNPYMAKVTAINTKNRNPDFDIENDFLKVIYSKKEKKDIQDAATPLTAETVLGLPTHTYNQD